MLPEYLGMDDKHALDALETVPHNEVARACAIARRFEREAAQLREQLAAAQREQLQLARAYDPNCEEYHFDEQRDAMQAAAQSVEALQELAVALGRDPEGCLVDCVDDVLGRLEKAESQLAQSQSAVSVPANAQEKTGWVFVHPDGQWETFCFFSYNEVDAECRERLQKQYRPDCQLVQATLRIGSAAVSVPAGAIIWQEGDVLFRRTGHDVEAGDYQKIDCWWAFRDAIAFHPCVEHCSQPGYTRIDSPTSSAPASEKKGEA